MLSWGKTVLERKKLECKSFLSYVFKDISFPPECDDRIKIKTLSSIISPPSTQILFSFFFILVLSGVEGMIPRMADIQSEIIELMLIPESIEILHKKAEARGLVFEDVQECARSIYFKLLPPACDCDNTVVIRDLDFTEKERAALITFMKVQSEWPGALSWREDVSGKADEGNV